MENMNINLLDLGDDILNIIGNYVKKDNHDRMEELFKKRMIMSNNIYYPLTKILKIDYGIKNKKALRDYIMDFTFLIDVEDPYAEIDYDHEIVKHFKLEKKVCCECGCMIFKNGLKTHQKTKKHLDLMEKEKDFKYADEGIEYLKKNNQFSEENINEIIYDRLFKSGRSRNDIKEYRKTRHLN
jgi:hypothetical protein